MSLKNDKIKKSKYGRIVWEHSTFTSANMVGFGFRLCLVIFLMCLVPFLIEGVFTILIRGAFKTYPISILFFIVILDFQR